MIFFFEKLNIFVDYNKTFDWKFYPESILKIEKEKFKQCLKKFKIPSQYNILTLLQDI